MIRLAGKTQVGKTMEHGAGSSSIPSVYRGCIVGKDLGV